MFTAYHEALDWIHGRLRLGIKPGLKRMEIMMEKLGHPERRLRTIHIGGTNGKGSTLTYLRCILEEAGLSVGTFTSPYFEQFNERISVNGHPISDKEIIELANVIYPLSEELEKTEWGGPTEFEIITAMSMYYFAHIRPVDIVLYEVGLGGRLDSTNIIFPLVSVITSIGLDHTNILGDTYAKIAYEKAGIIKNGVKVVTAVKQREALEVIQTQAEEKKAPLYLLGSEFSIENHISTECGERFSFKSLFHELDKLEIQMMGKHQTENAALAVMAAILLNNYYSIFIEDEHILSGLKRAYWPGRFEIITSKPLVMMDGAHNEEGIQSLVQELNKRYPEKAKRILFAGLNDKKLDRMIGQLDEIAASITFVDFAYPRAATAETLFDISNSKNKRILSNWKEAVQEEITDLKVDEMLIITGSLYFLSDVKPYLVTII
ncbi:bifunctional folylpolyglutamate synthase/dihydrofolate synthase [Cytobacillus sp. Hz8]|uniref:bifunctional folylpolyglutamate synthase/dihydrofolate synthase n=1 Tax=Cytobacillus sp. Hz8 TaxID=3347168 RepID=UPI0035E205C0